MYCAFCGSPLPEKAAFCPTCGAKVQAPPQAGSENPNGNGLRPALCSFCGSGSRGVTWKSVKYTVDLLKLITPCETQNRKRDANDY